jgi:hypothetical protein
LLLLAAATAQAQLPGAARVGRVRGVAIDSMLRGPLAGATVSIPAAGRMTVTDTAGRFVIDSVPPGEWRIGFHHPALDSLGLVDLEARVRVFANVTSTVELAAPSFETVSARLCDATSEHVPTTLVFGAMRTMPPRRTRVEMSVTWLGADSARAPQVKTSTAESGHLWVACGVPSKAWVQASVRDSTGSAMAMFVLGARGVAARDLTIADQRVAQPGTVRDDDGRPLAGARVSVVGDTMAAVTDANGAFVLGGLPTSTRTLDVRLAGRAPRLVVLDATGDPIAITMQPLTSRGADAPPGSDRFRVAQRRGREGRLMLEGNAGTEAFSALLAPACAWWLDGRPVPADFALAQPRRSLVAVERYARGTDAPPEYRSSGCAVVLLWTAASDW